MQGQTSVNPWWAALTVWGVVNAVNVLQTVGFLSRVRTGSTALNHLLGYVIIALAAPSVVALVAFAASGSNWLHRIGPAVFLLFVAFMVVVDYAWPVEFRSPMRRGILVPFLVLFFGSILLMGVPMYRLNRQLWFVTLATSALLLASMTVAIRKGVG